MASNVYTEAYSDDEYPLDCCPPRFVSIDLSTVLLRDRGLTLEAATEACTRAVHALHPDALVTVDHHDTRGWQGVCHHSYDTRRHWRVDEPVGDALRRVLEPVAR